MIITQDIIDRVKGETDIVELIGAYIPLKKNGTVWKGLCPFHNEKTPSFTVTPEKGIYFCFGCHATGDSIKWLQEKEGLTFPQAAKALMEKLNIFMEEAPANTLRPPQRKKNPFKKLLNHDPPAPKQADIQAVAEDSTERLLVSGCSQGLQKMISKRKWNVNVIASLAENNYLGANSEGKVLYIYPQGVKCRYDYDSSRGDRWVMGKAKGNIWRGNELEHELVDNVFVLEGETDLISLMSHRSEGVQDAYVAIPGSSNAKLTPTQAYRMGAGRNVFLMFDNDVAGFQAQVEMEMSLKNDAPNCKIYALDWSAIDCGFEYAKEKLNDIGDLGSETIKKIDNYFKRL